MPHVHPSRTLLAALLVVGAGVAFTAAHSLADGDTSGDRKLVASDWIYEDIDAGYRVAEETGKPLLVAFR